MKRNHFDPPVSGLFALLVLAWSVLTPASAAGEIEVHENYSTADFPYSITYHLSVSSQAPIDTIVLEYGVAQITCGSSAAKARPDFEAGPQVQANWTWDFRKSGPPPPGVRLWWRWTVRDKAGNELVVPEQDYILDDLRYDWHETSSSELVLASAVDDDSVNQTLWQAANEALEVLEKDIGARPSRPVKIFNYPTSQELRDTVMYTHDWAGGQALTRYDTVLLGVNNNNLAWGERAIAHELAHIVVRQLTFNCLGDLPTWLNEGLASYIEGDLEDYLQAPLDQAVASDTLLSLRSLSGSLPTSDKIADLAYAQSYSVVAYMIETYGPEKMTALLQEFEAGSTTNQALLQVYNVDTQGLDNEWRANLGLPPRRLIATPTPFFVPTLAPFGAATPAVTATPTSSPTPALPASTSTATPTAPPRPSPTRTPVPVPDRTTAPPTPASSTSPLLFISAAVLFIVLLGAIIFWVRHIRQADIPDRLSVESGEHL